MSRLLAALSLAFPLSGALAVNPTDQLVEEIVELSKQVGDQGEVVGDQKDFADALRRIASDRQGHDGRSNPPLPPTRQRTPWPTNEQSMRPQTGNNLLLPPPPTRSPYQQPYAAPQPAAAAPPPRRPPHVMLREAAFQLDRIAHELEMTELFEEADALRGTADKLRKSARKGSEKPSKPPKRERARGFTHPPDHGVQGGPPPGDTWLVPEGPMSEHSRHRDRLPEHVRDMIRRHGEARDWLDREQSRRLQPPQPPQSAPPRPEEE